MEVAGEAAVDAPALSGQEQLATQADDNVRAPAARLLIAAAGLLELAWLSGIGYFVYWLLS
jgi:hypothetical protein